MQGYPTAPAPYGGVGDGRSGAPPAPSVTRQRIHLSYQQSDGFFASVPAGDGAGGPGGWLEGGIPSGRIGDQSGGGLVQRGTTAGDEPPLLDELGINFAHIGTKTLCVLNPLKSVPSNIMDDDDIAGPFFFCLLLGFVLLFTGKVHFGYIYGVGTVSVICTYFLMNLMAEASVDLLKVGSILGYCLLPVVLLAPVSVFLSLRNVAGFSFAILAILWCTFRATFMFVSVLEMRDQRWLVAYPLFLLYATFALISLL